jgi:hypothetical protein
MERLYFHLARTFAHELSTRVAVARPAICDTVRADR